MAYAISMATPWAWYRYLNARRGRVGYLLLAALMMAGVYFCMNRSGWIGLIVALVIMAVFVPRFRRIFVLFLVIAAIVGGTYWAVIVASATVQERLTAQGPIDYRVDTWEVALKMLRNNLFFGVGYDNFGPLYSKYGYWDTYARVVPYPHNTYLWITLMGGLAALAPFLGFFASLIVSGFKRYRAQQPEDRAPRDKELVGMFFASIASIMIPAAVGDIFYCYYSTMLLFFIMGSFVSLMDDRADIALSQSEDER